LLTDLEYFSVPKGLAEAGFAPQHPSKMSEERGPRGIEWALLAVLAAMAAFAVLATGGIREVDFAIEESLMALALGLSVVRLWLHEKPVFHLSPVLWAVLAFAGYVSLRFATADIHYLAEDEWTRVMLYAAFFVVFTFHVFRTQHSQVLLIVLATVAVGSSLYAAYQYFSGFNTVWHFQRPPQYARRGSGTFFNPNNFAGYVAVLLPMMVAIVMAARVSITTRFLAGYAALMFLVGLAVSASRGGLLAAGGGLLALIFLLVRQRPFRMPALILLAVLLLGSFIVLSQATLTQKRFQDLQHVVAGEDARVLLWQSADEMWRDHFWLGVGPGHYDAVFPQYRPDILQQRKPYFVHNEYLNTLADYGLAGALLVLLAIGAAEYAFRYGWKGLRRDGADLDGVRSNRLALLLGASAGVTAALIHAFFDYNFHMPAYVMLVVFFVGLMAVAWRADNSRWWWRPRVAGKLVLTVLSLALATWFGLHAAKRTKEAKLLAQVKKAGFDSPDYLPLLEKAVAADPKNALTAYDVGEHYRSLSLAAEDGYEKTGRTALQWFARAAKLDPHDSYIPLRQGMTLIWLSENASAQPFLAEAERLNPKDYYTLALIGWCHFEMGEYQKAVHYFELSLAYRNYGNDVAADYLPRARARLESQTNPEQ
jgi:O-antigen ligase/cytochrome c-type biogenesis protein CcmH/NrfG